MQIAMEFFFLPEFPDFCRKKLRQKVWQVCIHFKGNDVLYTTRVRFSYEILNYAN